MQRLAPALLVLLVVASVAPAALAAGATGPPSDHSFAGTHVSFDVSDRAVTDYAVDGETVLDSVRVEESEPVDANASLSAATELDGAGLNLSATTETEARVAAETGATLAAHDNRRGVLVLASGGGTDYAAADLPAGATAEAESDAEVAVTTENGTEATVFVVGEGSVAVDDEGDVAARLGEDGRLAVRSYPDGKDDADDEQERLLVEGAASAEVYVTTERGNGGGGENRTERGNVTDAENATAAGNATETPQAVVDAVIYDANTTVEADRIRGGEVALAVNRTTDDGTILLASVAGGLLDAGEATATVDGDAATEAAAYSQLEGAVGSEQSRYVTGEGANDSAEVAVGVNHFSERTVAMASPDSADGEDAGGESVPGEETTDADPETTDADPETTEDPASRVATAERGDGGSGENGGVPGFTPIVAVFALFATTVAAVAWGRAQ